MKTVNSSGAWKGDPKLKEKFVSRLQEHRRLEHLTQGVGFEQNGKTKGCNIGCLFEHYDHAKGANESGIPQAVLRLADEIFEGLPPNDANDFAVEWPASIKPGADMTSFGWLFCAFLMRENIERVLTLKIDDKLKEQVVSAIRGVLALHEKPAAARAARAARAVAVAAWSAEAAARAAWSAAAASAAAAEWSAEAAARAVAVAASARAMAARAAARSAAEASAWAASASASASAAASAAEWSVAAAAAYRRYAKEFIRLCNGS